MSKTLIKLSNLNTLWVVSGPVTVHYSTTPLILPNPNTNRNTNPLECLSSPHVSGFLI